jgi:hypothetical protein
MLSPKYTEHPLSNCQPETTKSHYEHSCRHDQRKKRTLERQKGKSADTNLLDRFCRSEELNDFAAMAKALCPFFSSAFTSIPRRNSRANQELAAKWEKNKTL